MTFPGRIAGILLVMIVTPAFAGAQTFEPPRFTIGAAGGVSNPLHGDLQNVAPSWDVSVRGQVARGLSIEGFMSRWRHSNETVQLGVPITGPTGLLGRVDEVTIESGDTVSMVGFSFLPTFTGGRVTVTGGGGPAMMVFRRDYAQRFSGCTPVSVCSDSEIHRSNGTFAVQLASSVDVRLASRVTTFGQFRAGIPTEDPGSGHFAVSAGFRFVIR
jgi:hypothetical protein